MNNNDKESKKPQSAVALKYDINKAPKVVAKGDGHLADKIVEIAEEHGVTLYQDSELVKLLSRIEIDEEIPSNLYQAVAVVLAFVFQLNGQENEVSQKIRDEQSQKAKNQTSQN